MKESQIKDVSESLATALNGKTSFKATGFFTPPLCQYKILGVVNGVKATAFLGTEGGLAMLERFQAACPFELSIFKPEPRLALYKDITATVRAPFPVYANSDDLHADCIGRLFTDWASWRPALAPFVALDQPVVICDAQCSFNFPFSFIPSLAASIQGLAVRLSASPFKTLLDGTLTSRYSDKPYVKLQADNLPPVLKPLLPLAAKWSIGEDDEVMMFANKVGASAVRDFVSTFRLQRHEIETFCNNRKASQPFADEVIVFQLAFHAYALLEQV